MNGGKEFTKSNIVKIAIIAVVVIVLFVTILLVLNRSKGDEPTQGNVQQSTESEQAKEEDSIIDSMEDESSEKEVTQLISKEKVYTVIFKNYDGTILDTQKVEKGKAAKAPADPKREHFTFSGWDKKFDKVTSNLVVTATYTTTKTVIYAEHVTVDKGTNEVTMNIRVLNNPGIMGAVLKVSVDDKVFSFAEGKKTEYPGLTLTSSGSSVTSSPYTFMLDALELSADDKKDGTLFTVTFKVKDTAAVGKYNVELSYDKGAIFDEDYDTPKVVLENGTITIK